MKILICPDSYKGTLTATEAAYAMRKGVLEAVPDAEVVMLPVGDGGEGTSEALVDALKGSVGIEKVVCDTVDPLRRQMKAAYHIFDFEEGRTALIESAAASGLTLLTPEERDVMRADTYGTGLLIAHAYNRGIRRFVIGMGGSATCDGGLGAWNVLKDFDFSGVELNLLCDVDNPFCGSRGAAYVFGPQKGGRPGQLPELDARLRDAAEIYKGIRGVDISGMRHAGAAGGLAGMLTACFGAHPLSGIDKVLELIDFAGHLEGADLVITGEGKADATTLSGKAPMGILKSARRRGVPVALIAGRMEDSALLLEAGFTRVSQATPDGADPRISPETRLTVASRDLLKTFNILK